MIQLFWNAWTASSGNAWVNVMIWVALSLLFFEALNFFTKEKFVKWIEKSKNTQPIIAAVLGIIPGCGATLFLVPLYNKRKLTFGALVSSFIATMGDASFVVLVAAPMSFLIMTLISSVVAIIVGYIVDLTPIGAKITSHSNIDEVKQKDKKFQKELSKSEKKILPEWFAWTEKYGVTALFWFFIVIAFPAAVMTLVVPGIADQKNWYYDAMLPISIPIVISFLVYYLLRKIMLNYFVHRDDRVHLDSIHSGGPHKKDFLHILSDTTTASVFMLFWIFFGTFAYEFIVVQLIGEESFKKFITMKEFQVAMIFVGASIGLLPGCGPQIAFATIFIGGGMSGAAMTANTISQDGDAGFPLLATDKRGFMWIKVINFIPAILVGLLMLIPDLMWFANP